MLQQLERDGIRIISSAAEAHSQLGKVEKHGHLFEVILLKVLDQAQPKDRQEYEQCIVQTMNAKNELLNQHGLSGSWRPVARVAMSSVWYCCLDR